MEPVQGPGSGAPPSADSRSFSWEFPLLLLILLATCLAFFPSIGGEFVFDEHNLVLGNQRLRRWDSIPSAFFRLEEETAIVAHDVGTVGRYRPLPTCLATVVFGFFKLNAVWWHVINLALYLLTITVILSVFRRLCTDHWVYIPATLLFALHPIHTEVVAWVANFGNNLLGLGFALALWFHLQFSESGRRSSLILSLVFLQLALLSRETALIFPLVVFAYEWIYSPRGAGNRLGRSLAGTGPALAGVAFYLVFRYLALGGTFQMSAPSAIPWTTALLSVPEAVVTYVKLYFLPFGLSPVYPFGWVGTPGDPRFWGGLLVIVPLGYLMLSLPTKRDGDTPAMYFALTLAAIGLLPFLHLRALSPELILQDRYLFIASIGLSLWLAFLVRNVVQWLVFRPALAVALIMLPATGLGWLSFNQSYIWLNDTVLFQRAIEVSPHSSLAHQNLGMAYFQAHQLEEARKRFNVSITLGNRAAGYAGLGDVFFAEGNNVAAVETYELALSTAGIFSGNLLRNLGLAYFQIGNEEQALRSFELLASYFPDNREGFIHSGILLLKRKEFALSAERLRRARVLDPGDFNISYFLGQAFEGLGNASEAIKAYQTALDLAPGFKRAQARLQELTRVITK